MSVERISYAQSGQDILADYILRSRRLIPASDKYEGVYVDVGCCYPIFHSNTYFFYERGWRGVCIDANPAMREDFMNNRPRDLFVNEAIGAEAGQTPFFLFSNPQWNTFNPQRKISKSSQFKGEITIPIRPLSLILEEHLPINSEIDLLTIDTEGYEMQVLNSLDWERHRPKLIIAEIKVPMAEIATHKVTKLLYSKDYVIVSHNEHDGIFITNR